MTWLVYDNPFEVIPVDDLKPHVHGESCWCFPFYDAEEVLIHNSLDRREKTYEIGILQ